MVPSQGAAPSGGGGASTVSPGTSSPLPSSSSTWVVAAVVLLLSLPLGTVLDGLFLSGNHGPMQSAPSTLVDRFFTPHNPLPTGISPHQQRGEERGAQTEQLPPWAEALENNRVAAIVTAFFGAQVVRSVLIPNNAFEIFIGENLLWSTLDSGRMPNGRDLMQRLETIGVSVREPM
ncbi:hypothetical protein TGRH88_014480 [Toxoplasma gondii]|uniref:Selenoprotein T n=1 Tax=Toxoplasma gondii TaxID=5811 RepID=A0A7J6KBV4_TOXGO|nr:hypothetical protein TGRH88_014480 [Toxoplasma gondii]